MKKKYNSPKIEIIDIKSETDIAAMFAQTNRMDPGSTEEIPESMNSGFRTPFDNSSSPIYGDQD